MVRRALLLIGIDDTDRKDTPGTGRLSRQLLDELVAAGCESAGITRHQLLVHPSVPYTSHNSSACLGLSGSADQVAVADACMSFLRSESAEGSEPGLCVAWRTEVDKQVRRFGLAAQQQVLDLAQAVSLAEGSEVWLRSPGKRGRGMIGALAAVGLRAGGNDGRFIQLGQIRQAQGTMSVDRIKALGVDEAVDSQGKPLADETQVATLDWIRPRLEGHRAILYLERTEDDSNVWVPVDRSKSKRLKKSQ